MKLLLENRQAPGDLLVMSTALRALHQTYPGVYQTYVASTCPAIWFNNPHVITDNNTGHAKYFKVGYSAGINTSNQTYGHFASGFTYDIATRVGRPIKLFDLRPHVVLNSEGPLPGLNPNDYWVIMAGGKKDFTAKLWGSSRWQVVVDKSPHIRWVQAGSRGTNSIQTKLSGVVDLIGKTSFREFLRLVAHSRGVVCHVTSGMHAAAAFNKPCVVVAGGREPWWWEAYNQTTWELNCVTPVPEDFVPHAYLHTIGDLSCCSRGGCWRSGIGEKKSSNCINVVKEVERVPRCLATITPQQVLNAVSDYESGVYPTNLSLPLGLAPPLLSNFTVPKSHTPHTEITPRHTRVRKPIVKKAPNVLKPVINTTPIAAPKNLNKNLLTTLEVVIEPIVGFPLSFKAISAEVLKVKGTLIVENPSGNHWCLWLSPGVRPAALNWFYMLSGIVAGGKTVVSSTTGKWLIAAPSIVARLDGANWRTLIDSAYRVSGIKMRSENPRERV